MFFNLLNLIKDMLFFTGSYSNNVFPEPLSNKEEEECISKMLNGDNLARNKLIEHNLKRLGVKNVHVQAGDSTKLIEHYPPETFDRILLDAPCSGFGVLKRKPEIKYHDSSVMDGLIPLQALLLENAYNLLKNDGTMVYSTCTINKKENGMMIEHFIQKHPDMKVIEQRTILNYEYHTDGFYMCKMKKG